MNAKKFIGPVVLITYGYAATKSEALFSVSQSVQKWVWQDHPHDTTSIDNYLRWVN